MLEKGVSPSFHQPLYVVVMPPTRLDYPRTWSEFVARFHDDEGRQTEPQDVVGSGLKGIPPYSQMARILGLTRAFVPQDALTRKPPLGSTDALLRPDPRGPSRCS